jgi:hypothetical protein
MSQEPTLRLLLNAEDLAKVKVSSNGGPFTESLFSLRLLREGRPRAFGSDWLKAARAKLGPRHDPLAILDGLELLVDLHAVASEAPSIQEAVRWLEEAPSEHRDLVRGESEARRRLVRMFLDYHLLVVDPYWKRIRSHLEAERARCGQAITDGGVEHLLASLHPGFRWRAPFLEVTTRTSRQTGPDPRPTPARWHDGRATLCSMGAPSSSCRPCSAWTHLTP